MNLFSPAASKLPRLLILGSLVLAVRCFAYDTVWTGASGDFFDPSEWSVLVPTNNNSLNISTNGTVILDTNSAFNINGLGEFYMNYADIGDASGGPSSTYQGNIIINNGFIHLAENAGDSYWGVGFNTNGYSTFIVNGGVVHYDGPDARTGALWQLYPGVKSTPGISGVNGLAFNCGTATASGGTAYGRLELHSNAVMRIAHVLNFGNAGATTNVNLNYPTTLESGVLVMDGNSELDIGDGFGTGLELTTSSISLSNNAKLVIGNSMGIGATNGSSQQGYLTMGARTSTMTTITVSDHAQLNCMSLQSRAPANILVTNFGQFNVFNVLGGSGTVMIPYQSAYLAGTFVTKTNATFGEGTNVVFTVADHGRFYVDSFGEYGTGTTPVAWSNSVNGLAIGNGQYSDSMNGGAHTYGSKGTLIIKDFGTLDIRQCLSMGTADNNGSTPANSDGTLQVVGPNTTITIGSNLNLCIGFVASGTFVPTNTIPAGAIGRISEVITGPTHSTIIVSNSAYIHHQGTLQVMLQGYNPVGGETYTLIRSINGTNDGVFATNDFSSAPLPPGLVWQVSNTSTTVVLSVVNTFSLQDLGGSLKAVWSNETGFGTNLLFTNILQSSINAAHGYTDVVPTPTSPYTINPSNAAQFFRLRH